MNDLTHDACTCYKLNLTTHRPLSPPPPGFPAVGYGDIHATSNGEYVFCSILILINTVKGGGLITARVGLPPVGLPTHTIGFSTGFVMYQISRAARVLLVAAVPHCSFHCRPAAMPSLRSTHPLHTLQIVAAYILGTITALVVAADECTKTFRKHTANLATYTDKHAIPPTLHKSMQVGR